MAVSGRHVASHPSVLGLGDTAGVSDPVQRWLRAHCRPTGHRQWHPRDENHSARGRAQGVPHLSNSGCQGDWPHCHSWFRTAGGKGRSIRAHCQYRGNSALQIGHQLSGDLREREPKLRDAGSCLRGRRGLVFCSSNWGCALQH